MIVAWFSADGEENYIGADNSNLIEYPPEHSICQSVVRYCRLYIVCSHALYNGCKEDPASWLQISRETKSKHCRAGSHKLFSDDSSQFHNCEDARHGSIGVKSTSPSASRAATQICASTPKACTVFSVTTSRLNL